MWAFPMGQQERVCCGAAEPGVEAHCGTQLQIVPVAAPSTVEDSGDRFWESRRQHPQPAPRCDRAARGGGKETPSAEGSAFMVRSPRISCVSRLLPISFLICRICRSYSFKEGFLALLKRRSLAQFC